MASQIYETIPAENVTDDILIKATQLFNENYGTWGEFSSNPGKPVKLNVRRLREQYLPTSSDESVVDRHHRGKGFATSLLRILRTDHDTIYGVMSSHPAACLAAVKAFDRTIEKVDLDFIAKNANETMSTSPVPYIRDAERCGIIFDGKDTTGIVSGVNTKFFVDHEEPLKALAVVEKKWDWPLGKLPEGYEYLLILPASAS
ncbi:hypothetical protein DTO027I6_3049 [Penicillium roqueforti]|uniref:uncharacterized protein n=1 Tax=Penicillium roqueforti TaxID=5082 RepID=UPI00190B2FE3|nr:uncharacterized protein LCP9604111_132 [Penicillium roqueforti]KAF9252606.1 hypothetical protein LCP9604111_132 [Penicillium roqueforti]KAI1835668.1 hypothetical protein CBS147337_3691 [Penicillium roqueforti]KAI2675481.1 hypothetical protein CBS147355_6475 [Penicillium roqueforti]KAI2687096.1 hypothetical protein LCP963914a_3697 [Penicillium roqueforti]KAI2698440.1 hypothetical protein CBS147372_6970 [Penicillium roqueforti]